MKRVALLAVMVALVAARSALGQVTPPAERPVSPLSEGELLKTIDSLGSGDPLTKQPLSVSDPKLPGSGETSKDEKSEAKREKGPTEITANEATFVQKEHQAVFITNVVVKDPEFDLSCDKLTAYLKHDKERPRAAKAANDKPGVPTGKPVPAPANPPTANASAPRPPPKKAGGLERAIAEGNVVITQEKVETDGSISRNVGRAQKAVFESSTGDITLSGSPQVQQGINTCVATDESTVMILNRDGRMKVRGPHKTVIKETSGGDKDR